MSQWNDVYFRAVKDDKGENPIVGKTLSQCFDIITKTSPLEKPLDLINDSQWGINNSDNLTAHMNNCIYVRGTNLAPKNQAGQLYLYFSPAALLLYPFKWKENVIKLDGVVTKH